MPSVALTKAEFTRRARERFFDPAFDPLQGEIGRIIAAAWDGYRRRSQVAAHQAGGAALCRSGVRALGRLAEGARCRRRAPSGRRSRPPSKSRILLVNGSSRSDQTCPGEMSKTFRLVEMARRLIERERGFEVEVLDLSLLTSQYGRQILPCKACVSTAMPLCHWPCSCYPNHSLGQVNDWMAEIYPMWAAAHGVMIVTPVNWYQAPAGLKAMIDRLVCADGGNPDPTTTSGKDPKKAKEIELDGLGLSAPPRRPRLLGGRPRRHRRRRDAAPHPVRLAARHRPDRRRPRRRARPLCRLLQALCHQPRRSRRGHRLPGRGAQCRAGAGAGREADASWAARRARRDACSEIRPK